MTDGRIWSGLRITLLIHFVIAGLVGLQHLLLPRAWTDLAGMEITETVTWRLIGAALFAFALSSWLAYRQNEWQQIRIVVVMEVVWSALGAVVILWGLLAEGLPPLEWVNFALLAAFSVAFAISFFECSRLPDGCHRLGSRDGNCG
jgi:hypothetical protein